MDLPKISVPVAGKAKKIGNRTDVKAGWFIEDTSTKCIKNTFGCTRRHRSSHSVDRFHRFRRAKHFRFSGLIWILLYINFYLPKIELWLCCLVPYLFWTADAHGTQPNQESLTTISLTYLPRSFRGRYWSNVTDGHFRSEAGQRRPQKDDGQVYPSSPSPICLCSTFAFIFPSFFKKNAVSAFAMDSRGTLLTSVTAFLQLVAHCFLLLLDS